MIEQIEDLVRFYSHQHHVPITVLTDSWQVESWDRSGLAVALPGNATVSRRIADMVVSHEPDFGKQLPGDLIVCGDVPVARVGRQWIVLLIWPKNTSALAFARKLVDQHLPRICRQYRREMREQLVESIGHCVHDRKRELQSSIREDSYELERLSLQMMQLSRKLETDRAVSTETTQAQSPPVCGADGETNSGSAVDDLSVQILHVRQAVPVKSAGEVRGLRQGLLFARFVRIFHQRQSSERV